MSHSLRIAACRRALVGAAALLGATARSAAAQTMSERSDTTAPEGVIETPHEVASGALKLGATLTMPADHAGGPIPVAVIVAGSGPTDRNGNSVGIPFRSNVYAQLAWGLARHGIASVRYDKRGLGASGAGMDPTTLTLADFRADAAAAATSLAADRRFSRVVLIGHSEGAGLVLEAANHGAPVAGIVMMSGMGRPLAEVLHDQFSQQMDSASLERADTAVARFLRGESTEGVPPLAATVLVPAYRTFLRSMAAYDPPAELRRATVPVLLVHGGMDVQVTDADFARLRAARPDAATLHIPAANHVFKAATTKTIAAQMRLYQDGSIPIVPELVPGIARWIAALK